jgi:hypothetical protein
MGLPIAPSIVALFAEATGAPYLIDAGVAAADGAAVRALSAASTTLRMDK